ncbi:MAG: dioxygenase [Nitrospinae bacterium]|nr:dioxygenase [Nitrospinota bacterium]
MMETVVAPALFISHGAPTVLLEKDGFHEGLKRFAAGIPKPAAIVVLSAHLPASGRIGITSCAANHVIYDFGGFAKELFAMEYSAPGYPALAERIAGILSNAGVDAALDEKRGLDHGAWVPLKILYPSADVPVVQVSMPYPAKPETVMEMGKALALLRGENILLIGSGSMTHNLGALNWRGKNAPPEPAYASFEQWVMEKVAARDVDALSRFMADAPNAPLAHPEADHFLPLFFALGCANENDSLEIIFRGWQYGTLSMTTFAFTRKG